MSHSEKTQAKTLFKVFKLPLKSGSPVKNFSIPGLPNSDSEDVPATGVVEISGFEPAFDPEGVSSGFTAPPPLLFEGGVAGPLGAGSGSGSGFSGSGFSGSGFSGSSFPEVGGVSGSGVVSCVNNEEFSK
jgi:hypothetical protein